MKGGRLFNPRVASHHFRSLSAFQNPPKFSQIPADPGPKVRNSDPTVFSLFNCITRTEGISPNKYTYTIMINYCVQTNRLNLAFSFLGRLLKEGHRAEAVIFNPILRGLCYENRIGEAVAIVTQKMPQLRCIPDVEAYNSLIDGFCKKGEIEKAGEVLHSMISKGIEPNAMTYDTLIDRLCKKGEIEKAEEVLHSMISKGFEPDFETYNVLIDGFCKKGEMDKAEEVLHSMIFKGIEPNVVIYSTLIDGLFKKGDIEMVEVVLHSMISKGLEPTKYTYCTLIDRLFKKGEIEKAENLTLYISLGL